MTNEENKTKELVARAKSGDQQAFVDLYDSYYAYAYRAIGDIIIDQGEREDVVQEAFLRCFTKLQQGESVENFGGFIATAAKNIAKDHIKAREAEKRPKEVLSSFGQSDGDAEEDERDLFDAERSEVQKELERASEFYQTPEERFEEQEVAEIIQEILAELPDYQQEALSMFYMEQMTYPEIAELYGESVNTIKSRVNQGKKKVEAKILDYEKKNKIKLHSVAPLTFFFYLLRQKAVAEAATMPVAKCLSAGTVAGAKSAGSKGVFSAIKNFFSKKVMIAGKAISTKAIAGVVIGAVGVGTIVGVSNGSVSGKWLYQKCESGNYDAIYRKLQNKTEYEKYEFLVSCDDEDYCDRAAGWPGTGEYKHTDTIRVGKNLKQENGWYSDLYYDIYVSSQNEYYDCDEDIAFWANPNQNSFTDVECEVVYKNESNDNCHLYVIKRTGHLSSVLKHKSEESEIAKEATVPEQEEDLMSQSDEEISQESDKQGSDDSGRLSDLADGSYWGCLVENPGSMQDFYVKNIEFVSDGMIIYGKLGNSSNSLAASDGAYFLHTNENTVYTTPGESDFGSSSSGISQSEFQQRYVNIKNSQLGIKFEIKDGVLVSVGLFS